MNNLLVNQKIKKESIITSSEYQKIENLNEFLLYCDNILEGITLLNTLTLSNDLLSFKSIVYEPIDQPIYIFSDDDFSMFSKNSQRTDGLSCYCKNCCVTKSILYQGKYKHKVKDYQKKFYKNNKEKILFDGRKRWEEDRRFCLVKYSGEIPSCACCGEDKYEFLALDHIQGGGNKQRKDIGGNLVRWLKRNNFPTGYRVLCHNCNHSMGARGYCPHGNFLKSKLI